MVSAIVWLTSFFLRRSPGIGGRVVLVALGLVAIAASVALGQGPTPSSQGQAPQIAAPAPAYEVATIKPAEADGPGILLRGYIQAAFGLPSNTVGLVLGPDWINNTRYMIQAKPPDSIRDAMQTMTSEEKSRETRLMMQSLLADRFQLKAHFETREMPVYELVVAKGGSKLKEAADPARGAAAVGRSAIRGTAIPMRALVGLLPAVPDIGGREVIDKTGLTGVYDFSLKWTPLQAAGAGENGAAPASGGEEASFFTAIEEQLGLKLVPDKEQGQVLVIDRIEQPSEN